MNQDKKTFKLIWKFGTTEQTIIIGNKALCVWKQRQVEHYPQFNCGRLIIEAVKLLALLPLFG